ncbi:hypothetical protein [Kitasatospora sp. NBC_01302]|uniref:hypothetical protein n=1 Tax=Kitasatospora sp. NBC_01302 TaxID=2903575 RepID=UPI002E130362|nr:hypothetical protein OG294_14430 [Kitasatospora sp. NBC_01302]
MPELNAASLQAALSRIRSQGIKACRTGLIGAADAVVKQARTNATNGSHAWGTPTPARPGAGPAVISGTLKNSITREAVVRNPVGWTTKVGLQPGRTPPYGNHPTESSKYGLYLETGLRNGATYPFLGPAAKMAGIQANVTFSQAFAVTSWTTDTTD